MTNHELQEVLVGIIARMRREDRDDFYRELMEYVPLIDDPDDYPDRYLSKISAAIAARPDLEKDGRPQTRRKRVPI